MTTTSSWRPSAQIQALRDRAEIIARVRAFFAERGVLEVETPLLSSSTVTDPHLQSFATQFRHPLTPGERTLYLQTSPEYAMKRLLCAGSGPIFQLTKAFRNEEAGRHHNPEFCILEWYRPGFDHWQLMDEVDEFVQAILGSEPADKISYQQAFITHLKLDPLSADLAALKRCCQQQGFAELAAQETDKDTLLQLLFNAKVEPGIGRRRPCLVYGFPASQSALARIDDSDPRIARRFELYFQGLELANGFHELADKDEQHERFIADNRKRRAKNLQTIPIDQHLLGALVFGLPDCAGVALGIDRLVMLALKKDTIDGVIAYSIENA